MKKRVLSLLLAVMMVVSTMTIIPLTATAAGDTFNASDAEPLISTRADFDALRAAVRDGNSFAGKTIKLACDVDMGGTHFESIGYTNTYPFSGSFDGQGHTVANFFQDFSNGEGEIGGLFGFICVPENGTITIKNFALVGNMNLRNSSYVGCLAATLDAGKTGTGGTINFQGVYVDVFVNCFTKANYLGGFVGFIRHEENLKPLTINVDECVSNARFDLTSAGVNNVGGFIGYTGWNRSGRALTINFKNSMFTGYLQTNSCGASYMDDLGLFVAFTKTNTSTNDTTAKITVTMSDCISTGEFKGTNLRSSDIGIVVGEMSNTPSNGSSVTVTNLYYKNTKNVPVIGYIGSGMSSLTNCVIKDNAGFAALTASDFTDGSKWSFGSDRVPYPKYIADNFITFPIDTVASAADLVTLQTLVANGNTYEGKTVTLAADITLPSNWTGIGVRSTAAFCGTFDGQGHTVTFANTVSSSIVGGLFGYLGNGAVVKNLKTNGTLTTSGDLNFIGIIANCTKGTVNMTNIHNSTNIQTGGNFYYSGGFVGFMEHSANSNLTIDGCIYDGTINAGNQVTSVAGFVGYTGNYNSSGVTKTLTIKNSVYAGVIAANDPSYYESIAGFVGLAKRDNNATAAVTVKDCISAGKFTYNSGKTWSKGTYKNGVIIGNLHAGVTTTLTNVYYLNIDASVLGGTVLPVIGENTASASTSGATAKTATELGALTSAAFSDGSKWGFKAAAGNTHYVPCPAYFATVASWPASLTKTVEVVVNDYYIDDLADLQTLQTNVLAGNNYSGKTWHLNADITLPANWIGIGERSSYPFCGTFDGEGYTITFANTVTAGEQGALFRYLGNGAVVQNLTLDGEITVTGGANFFATLANCVTGNVEVKNVRSSTGLKVSGVNISYAGGLIGFMSNYANVNLTIDGCVVDGTYNFGNYLSYFGGFVGYTGNVSASDTKTLTIKNSAFAGQIAMNATSYSTGNGGFVGQVRNNGAATITLNFTDCVSIGKLTYNRDLTWDGDYYNGTLIGCLSTDAKAAKESSSSARLNLTNVYYFNVAAHNSTEETPAYLNMCGSYQSASQISGTATVVTEQEMAALTAANFSAQTTLTFTENGEWQLYYPCPTCVDAAVMGKVLNRCEIYAEFRDTADGCDGVRFVATFFDKASITNIGTRGANCGIFLLAATTYTDELDTVAELETAGALKVNAFMYKDGGDRYTMSVVVTGTPNDECRDVEMVAIAYIGDSILSSTVTSSYNALKPVA